MSAVTVRFGGICTFFLSQHPALDGFCRAVLVNAANGRTVAGQSIPPHIAKVQIGDGERVTVQGLHMRLVASSNDSLDLTDFVDRSPNLTVLMGQQRNALLGPPSGFAFDSDPAEAALYFDFKSGMLQAGRNERGAVVTTLTMEGDQVALETGAFGGGPVPAPFPSQTIFREDTTILISNDDEVANTSKYDFYLHYLTAEDVPNDPPIPDFRELRRRLPVIPHLPRWYGAIGAGCSNSTYP